VTMPAAPLAARAPEAAIVALGTACLVAVIAAVTTGRLLVAIGVAGAPLVVVAADRIVPAWRRIPRGYGALALVWLVLISGTLVWRRRSTEALNADPLDDAAIVRILLIAVGGVLAVAVLTRVRVPKLPPALALLGCYGMVALVAALVSPRPGQALYRAVELVVGVAALVAAHGVARGRGRLFVARLCIGVAAVLIAIAWLEAAVVPADAFPRTPGFFSHTLRGYLPAISSNGIGALGGLVAVWAFAEPPRRGSQQAVRWGLFALGAATLLAAQYRTGIVAFLVALALVAWWRSRGASVLFAAAAMAAVLFVGWGETRAAAVDAFAKDHPELVGTLNNRTTFWKAAIPLVEERPVLGWGLNVGSREVLSRLGHSQISTLHGTWAEAAVGTGLTGAALLVAAMVAAIAAAFARRRQPEALPALGALTFLAVRSITGPTIEGFGFTFLLFGALALAVSGPRRAPDPREGLA
jgi:O-antigen ligase